MNEQTYLNRSSQRFREPTGGTRGKTHRGLGKVGKGDEEMETPSYKINKSWRCNVHIENMVHNVVTSFHGDIDWAYCGDHSAVYKSIKSPSCTQDLLPLLWSLKVRRYRSHIEEKYLLLALFRTSPH